MHSDQYSLGALIFLLLAGQGHVQLRPGAPYSERQVDFAPLTSARPELPGAVDEGLRRRLAPEPHRRFPGLQEAVDSLAVELESSLEALHQGYLEGRSISSQMAGLAERIGSWVEARVRDQARRARPMRLGEYCLPPD